MRYTLICGCLAFWLFGVAISPVAQENSVADAESGQLFIRLHPFPYKNDDLSYNSYGKLRDINSYVVRVFPENGIRSALKFARDARKGDTPFSGPPGFEYEMITIGEGSAPGVLTITNAESIAHLRTQIADILQKARPLTIVIRANVREVPAIPLPQGEYFLEYSLKFADSANPRHQKVHPNYPHINEESPSQTALRSVTWGPPLCKISSGNTTSVEFLPTDNINFYEYDEADFQNSKAFANYKMYLDKNGIE